MGYVHIMTILVDMYARFGRAKFAGIMFGEMPEQNVVSCCAMIACYAWDAF